MAQTNAIHKNKWLYSVVRYKHYMNHCLNSTIFCSTYVSTKVN